MLQTPGGTRETPIAQNDASSKGLGIGLWIVQSLLFIVFVGIAVWKVATPLPKLAAMIPWAGQVSPAFLYFTAAANLAGRVGVLLPSLTRIQPGLTVAAAIGCVALQASAMAFYSSRGGRQHVVQLPTRRPVALRSPGGETADGTADTEVNQTLAILQGLS